MTDVPPVTDSGMVPMETKAKCLDPTPGHNKQPGRREVEQDVYVEEEERDWRKSRRRRGGNI